MRHFHRLENLNLENFKNFKILFGKRIILTSVIHVILGGVYEADCHDEKNEGGAAFSVHGAYILCNQAKRIPIYSLKLISPNLTSFLMYRGYAHVSTPCYLIAQ